MPETLNEPLPPATGFRLDRPIALVGLMGVGKTTIGRRLAEMLDIPFRDADEEIEKSAGQSISDIFTHYGEAAFRDGEQKVITRLLEEGPHVLATGGGAFVQPGTREILKQKAITLWLRTDPRVLARRLSNRSHRPLLSERNPLEVLQEQEKARYPFYALADITVDTGDQSHTKSVEHVLHALETYLRQT